ncbi:hypothetical protein Tco_1397193, partial [Tanacetum coccineum]
MRYHLHTAVLVENEDRHARQAWGQTQLTTTLGRIQTLEARELACTDNPEDAGSS